MVSGPVAKNFVLGGLILTERNPTGEIGVMEFWILEAV